MHRLFRILFAVVLSVITLALCELAFRAFDRFTNPNDNIDVWVKRTNQELREHPLLGYTYPPGQIRDDGQQIDEFGMPNLPEALQWNDVDIVGVGDSYVQAANRSFLNSSRPRTFATIRSHYLVTGRPTTTS